MPEGFGPQVTAKSGRYDHMKYMGRVVARLRRRVSGRGAWSDAGMAMIGVVMFGGALVVMSATVMARGNAQFGTTDLDRNWEYALTAAESALSWGLATVEADVAWGTGDVVPPEVVGTSDERGWAIAAADAKDGSSVVPTPTGEFVVVKPANTTMVYGVGYAPDRDAVNRRVRVVRAGYQIVPTEITWVTNLAILTQSDLQVTGNPSFYTGPAIGIHTNGHLTTEGSTTIDGCLSASSGATMGGSSIQGEHCPPPGDQPPMPVPVIDAADRWHTSTHDLCTSGRVRAGPAHPTLGHTTGEQPCTGQIIENDANANPYNGWKFNPTAVEKWHFESQTPFDGVFYVHHNSLVVTSSPGSSSIPWKATLIATSSGECPTAVEGDIRIEGHPTFDPYPGSGNLALVAGRDIRIQGNPNVSGVVAAEEQIEVSGTATVTGGTYVSSADCDTPGSPVSVNFLDGNATVHNETDVETDLTVWVDLLVLLDWAELRS